MTDETQAPPGAPGVVDDALIETILAHADKPAVTDLGEVTALMIGRYARAVGETDDVFYDVDKAKDRGFRGIVAPLNLLPSIVDWTNGPPEADLWIDGTVADESAVGLPKSGYRIMGGGERMEFADHLVAGDRVLLTSYLSGVEKRETRSGPMAIVSYKNVYDTDQGLHLMTCTRSVLVRTGEQA